ncbi:uncharacterized protein TNCV_381551 [Trichonephila clavipes]|uniref:Uncharacterized protein n=1 Tax=Trichonephila clavipes TaxID=2585209 RepID=A0A8X6SEB2_TRICX|nr:uncharacterized protein TNCV_381551 [Trichonephila clavipes]
MTAQRYVHDMLQPHVLPIIQRLLGAIFLQDNYRPHTTRVSQDWLRTVTTIPWPSRYLSNRAYLGSFGTVIWAFHEFEQTRGKVTANMERNVSRHHTELVKQDISSSWRQASVHEWYEGNRPGAVLLGTGSRRDETTLSGCFAVEILELNGMWHALKFTLLVQIATSPKPLLPISWPVLVEIRARLLSNPATVLHRFKMLGFMDLI